LNQPWPPGGKSGQAGEAATFLAEQQDEAHPISRLSWISGTGLVMRQVNMHEAKTHLSRLVEEAAAGDGFVICKAGRPMVRVSPLSEPMVAPSPRRRLGLLQGHCSVPDDFDQLGSNTMADLFEGF